MYLMAVILYDGVFPGGSEGKESTNPMQKTEVQSLGWEETEDPGGLKSMGRKRVGYN